MPAKTGSRNGLKFEWALGENNWNVGMDDNLKFLDRFGVHLSFKSFLNTPPGTPTAGDCYVIDTAPTDAWAGKTGQVAVYDDGAWRYGTPRTGWLAYCEADGEQYVFDGGWSIASSGGGGSDVMAAKTIKGNKNAVSAAAQDLTPAEARTVMELGTAAVADTGTGPSNVILGNDSRLSDAREWSAETVSQVEAEAGTATTRRAWTAQRVWQAIAAWWEGIKDNLSSIGVNGDIEIKGFGRRIRGDFSSAPVSYRVMFQTSTVNGNTTVGVLPNGTNTISGFNAFNSSEPNNASIAALSIPNGIEVRLASGITGTGTYLPMTIFTGGSERMRIDTSGNVLVTSPAGLGYGSGAGGSVTQTTSKSTAVTLNKPTGRIASADDALGAGVEVSFILNNSLLASSDVLVTASVSGNYSTRIRYVTTGSAMITIKNESAGSLSTSVLINFAIIKGSAS